MIIYKKNLKQRYQTKVPLDKRKCIDRHDGFTLLELILYIAISSMFMLALTSFSWDLMFGRLRSEIQNLVNAEALLANRRIAYEIKNASGITSVTASSITLTNNDANRNPTVIDLSSGRLRIGYGNSGSCPTSSPCFLTGENVTIGGVLFQNRSSGNSSNIEYAFTVTSQGGADEFDYSETVDSSAEIRSL